MKKEQLSIKNIYVLETDKKTQVKAYIDKLRYQVSIGRLNHDEVKDKMERFLKQINYRLTK